MSFLGELRKRWAIRGYVRKLPRMLRNDYGFAQVYTAAQIMATIERNGLNRDHSAFAIAMFSDPAGFAQFQETSGVRDNYEAMRSDVAFIFFKGNIDFTVSDVMHAFPDAVLNASADGADGHGDGGGSH